VTLLLDTTVLIDILRGRLDRRRLLAGLVERGDHLATASINVGEVFGGLRPTEETGADVFLRTLEVYPLTAALARDAGVLQYAWARKGKTLSLPDTIVAATALEHGLTLMTDNRKDFPMAELNFFPLP
jgi:predicted nucleic acid-binding protein